MDGVTESIPTFFVPGENQETAETTYAELAALGGRTPAPVTRRIYSITVWHDREEWTATVGKNNCEE